MAKFEYTAEKTGGEVYRGIAEAADRFALYEIVRKEGGHILALTDLSAKGKWDVNALFARYATRVKEYDKILFARNLGAMLGAGLALARALSVMERQTRNPKLQSIIGEIASDVRRGTTLHDALGKFPRIFSHLFVAMVKAGEEGGDLPGSLAAVSDGMERIYAIKKKVQGALIYPSIILVAIFGIGYLMMTQVVPTLAQTFAEMHVSLPPQTQIVLGISNFLVHDTLLVFFGAVLLGGVVYACARLPGAKRAFEFVMLHTPAIGGIVREVNAARTARTLASLLASGVDVLTALSITAEVVQNSFFRDVIAEAARGVQGGEPLATAFIRHENLYPAFVGEMMSVGEETGETNDMLKRLALFYEDEVDRRTKDMSTIVEPFLMILIGAAVGFFAISMIEPIYSLSQTI